MADVTIDAPTDSGDAGDPDETGHDVPESDSAITASGTPPTDT